MKAIIQPKADRRLHGKIRDPAQQYQLALIGQVTGPNGKPIQQASDCIVNETYLVKAYDHLSLKEIEQDGLDGTQGGSVIVFR
ncbi:MAG: hypothetical protein AAF206_29680 [Bacteroidota bacterium]